MYLAKIIGRHMVKDVEPPNICFFQDLPRISFFEAEKILDDYQRLKKRKSRKKWVEKISINQIINWSKFVYWGVMDDAESKIRPENPNENNTLFAKEFFYFLEGTKKPFDTLLWLAYSLETENVETFFPGLKSEYIRRFENGDRTQTGYDKMLHFLWGAALPIKYGRDISNLLMCSRKTLSFFFSTCRDINADLRAHFEGYKFL